MGRPSVARDDSWLTTYEEWIARGTQFPMPIPVSGLSIRVKEAVSVYVPFLAEC